MKHRIFFMTACAFLFGAMTAGGSGQVKKLPERSKIDDASKWKLEDIYHDNKAWDRDFTEVENSIPELEKYKGRLGESADALLEFFRLRDSVSEITGKLYVYSKMRKDEDTRSATYQAMSDRSDQIITKLNEATAFVRPELLAVPEETLRKFVRSSDELAVYEHALDDLIRSKKHILSQREEELLAMSGEVFNSPQNVFTMLNNADIKFPVIKNEKGEDIELTKGNFSVFLNSRDRAVRKNAWTALYSSYEKLINTIASSFSSQIKRDAVLARARHYDSALEAALFDNNIPVAVYENLIASVHENLEPLRRYVQLRKKLLILDKVHLYDIYVPLFSAEDDEYVYDDAKDIVIQSLKALGETYVTDMSAGLNGGWVDVYENVGKRSGAYSWGSYGTHPYVLLNYSKKLDDVFTLAHELGHAMHSFYTRGNQPYAYGDYTIFVAEVASITNESILMRSLINRTEDKEKKLVLLNRFLDNIVGTFYRQTMFAEFEKIVHEAVENGEPLTATTLKERYGALYKSYYGDELTVDEQLKMEWARIPHFYYNFYVFQYATGFAAATALANKILEEGQPARDKYLKFLSSGSSQYSIDLLKTAGVDMTTRDPVENVSKLMNQLLDEVEQLLE